jgi:hypothetical protein
MSDVESHGYRAVVLVVLVLAAVTLVPPFGEATATAISDADGLAVEIIVSYRSSAEAVIARPYSAYEELPPTVLSDRGDGTFGGIVVFPTSENWSVGFEAFRTDGESDLSDGATLTEMGVDPIVVSLAPDAPLPSDGLIPEGGWWLIAGIGLALAALGLVGWWAFSEADEHAVDDAPDTPDVRD